MLELHTLQHRLAETLVFGRLRGPSLLDTHLDDSAVCSTLQRDRARACTPAFTHTDAKTQDPLNP
jgi:hypothetical protein